MCVFCVYSRSLCVMTCARSWRESGKVWRIGEEGKITVKWYLNVKKSFELFWKIKIFSQNSLNIEIDHLSILVTVLKEILSHKLMKIKFWNWKFAKILLTWPLKFCSFWPSLRGDQIKRVVLWVENLIFQNMAKLEVWPSKKGGQLEGFCCRFEF